MALLAKWIVILFGCFLISAGFLMLFYPSKARAIIGKAGSTNFINYTEITIRMIPAAALITYADFSKYPEVFFSTRLVYNHYLTCPISRPKKNTSCL